MYVGYFLVTYHFKDNRYTSFIYVWSVYNYRNDRCFKGWYDIENDIHWIQKWNVIIHLDYQQHVPLIRIFLVEGLLTYIGFHKDPQEMKLIN